MEHYRTCHLCEAMCGIKVTTEGERVVAIRGDEQDPFSRGYICPKATALGDIHHDPDRLQRPCKRIGPVAGGAKSWVEISWDQALSEVATQLRQLRHQYGRHAVAVYSGNPVAHNYGALLLGSLFVKALGSRSRFSATSVDQLPKMLAGLSLFGHQLLMPVPDIDRTDYFLILGANPVVSNGSLMSAPGMRRRLAALLARGGRVVLFDPRRSETAELASEHVFIRPGSDALLLCALLHVILHEAPAELLRLGRLAPHVKGLDAVRSAVADFAPEAVAAATAVPAATTRRIAREFALAERAVAYGRVGVSMQEFGGIAHWLLEVLNTVTGHLDCAGGAMFPQPAVDVVQLASWLGMRGSSNQFRSRVRGLPEFGGELPVACLAEEIETPGDKQIRALVAHAGNPVLSAPNGRRLDAALGQLDFMVAIDIYRNETSRHANIILPPTFGLEHDHYDVAFHSLAVRNTTKYSPALFARRPDQRHDWEILLDLTVRLADSGGLGDRLRRPLTQLLRRPLAPRRIVDLLLRLGPYGLRRGAAGLSLRKVAASVHGIDLGPLSPALPQRIEHADRKIDLAPPRLLGDMGRLRQRLAVGSGGSGDRLQLIGRRLLRTNNSWSHNSLRLVKGPAQCVLLIHPVDAAARGIVDGAAVRIASRVGAIEVPAALSADMMPGVVSLPHGFGHDRAGTGWQVAEAHAGASINDLTDEQWVDSLAGTSSFSGLPVQVSAVAVAVAT